MFALSTHPRSVGKHSIRNIRVEYRFHQSNFLWMFVVMILFSVFKSNISALNSNEFLGTSAPTRQIQNRSTMSFDNLSFLSSDTHTSQLHSTLNSKTLAIILPDPDFCNLTLLEKFKTWTKNMASQMQYTLSPSPTASATDKIAVNSSKSFKTEIKKITPKFTFKWHTFCEVHANNQGRENIDIFERPDVALYKLFEDPGTCIVLSLPKRQELPQRYVERNQHWQNLYPQQDEKSGNKEVFDIWSIEDIRVPQEDFYHNVLSLAPVWQKPYIAANGDVIVRDVRTPHMISLVPKILQIVKALSVIFDHFHWQHLVIISNQDGYWLEFARKMFVELVLRHFYVKSFIFETDKLLSATEGHEENITYLDKGILLCMGEEDIHHLLFRNQNIGIIEKHHAVIMFNPSPYRTVQEYIERIISQTSKSQPQHMATIHNILEYTFVLQVSFLSELPSNYASSVVDLNVSRYFVENKQDTHNLHYTSIIRDVLQMLLYTNNNSSSCPSTAILKKSLQHIAFRSPAGWILIGKENLVHFEYKLYDFNPSSQDFELVLQLSPHGSKYKLVLNVIQGIFWPNGLKIYPDPCFKTKENCIESDMSPLLISLIVTSVIGVVSLICLLYMVTRRYFLQRQVEKGPNKIVLHNDDLIFVHRKKSTKIPKSTTLFGKPGLLRGSEPSNSMSTLNEISEFSETARYNGDMIYVKDLKIKHSDMKSRPKLMSHLKLLRELRHENLNPFIGFLNDPARPSFITEYCTRGSLEDVICNFDIKLDWEFKLSLLTDLVRGLRYIQSCPLRYHGNLKSRNCVIDSRWVLKITDYGIPGMLEGVKADRNLTAEDMLWFAPEVLRNMNSKGRWLDKSDVYSLSIIMQEIILRNTPYSSHGLSAEEIIQKVKKPPPLIRPSVSPQAAPPHYIQLMKQCWAENPDMRPDIENIYHQFKEFNNGRKQNFVDTMFKMLEKYSTDLEDIVRERTMQLEEEKKKTDQLLYRMLPSSVAECLKCGRRIEAENYSDVTIYFSDIVGFTSISAMSTAMEVVNILNELYTMFDATIDKYDVYKVETIGDAYMVVSGLPERNGIKHAGEIGTMALDLLYQCGNLRVNHLWNMPLLLRIGLHTGPCAAGVVGLSMPRYCLFGDTVNTASRMESTGQPFRIHLSGCTKAKLDELGGYKFKYRGEVELKGKGIANTYWLVGKEGFDGRLPADPTKGMSGMSSSQLIEELMRISKEAAEKEEQMAANKAVPVVIESPTSNTADTSPVASNTRSDVSKTSPTVSHQIFTNASVHDDGRDLVAIHTRTGSQKGTSLFNDLECLDTRPIARNTSYATGICKSWGNITKVDNMALHSGDRMQTPGIVKSALRRISSHKFDKRESKLALPRRGSTPKATDGLELKVVLSKSDQIFHPDMLRPVFTHKGGSFRRVDPIDTKFSCVNKDKNNSMLKNTKPSCEPEKHNTKEMLLISRDASRKCASDQPVADTGRPHSKKESRKIKALDTTAVFPVETISVISKPELFEQKDTSPKKSSPLKLDKNEENMAGDICNFSNPKV